MTKTIIIVYIFSLTAVAYWIQSPCSSSQYQAHSVVSMKVGCTTDDTVESRRTPRSPRVIVSKHTGSTPLLQWGIMGRHRKETKCNHKYSGCACMSGSAMRL